MPIAFLTALAVAAQAYAPAPMVTGQVLDPRNLPVAGAIVRVECGELASAGKSDAFGRFALRAPIAAHGCVVRVEREGFAAWTRPLAQGGDLKARLTLAAHHESLTVRGSGELTPGPGSGVSDGDILRRMTNRADTMIDLARAMAGAGQADQRVYVDGSPRAILPTAERLARVAVNPDPYSAAFGDLDGARVEVETMPLARAWRYTFNASPGSISGENPLGAGHQWKATSIVAGVSGPLPGTALAWSTGVRRVRREQESPLLCPAPGCATSVVQSREELGGIFAVASYERGATRVIADVNVQDDRAFASGAGVLVLPDAASDLAARVVEINASVRHNIGSVLLSSSGTMRLDRRSSQARSTGQGFTAAGTLMGGGAAVATDQIRSTSVWWAGRVAGLAAGRPWRAGATVNASAATSTWTPNPLGTLELTADGTRAMFTRLETGSGAFRHQETNVAGYGEMQIVRSRRFDVTTGLRFDARRGAAAVSPRISASATLSKTTVTFGAGQFVEALEAPALLPLYARAGGGTTYLAIDDDLTLVGMTRVSVLPRRQQLASIGATRPWGALDLAAEYRWSRTDRVPSLARESTASGWDDVFESSARRRDREARVRARIGRGERTFVAYYAWRQAVDTADGWWGAPISPTDPVTWAPSIGIAAHEGGFVLSLEAPGGIQASLLGSLTSGRTMDEVFAATSLREALQPPLRPGGRNSALGPSTASVQLFASRAVKIEALHVRGRIGAQIANLLGRRNVLAPVNVVNSPLYGRPTAAASARSLSIWFALGQ